MPLFNRSLYRAGLIGGAALALSLAPMNARGQQVSTQTNASTQTATSQQNTNPDLRNWELARMDQFLDDHPDINKDLTAKPSLINDQRYLAQHKELQSFLNSHPQVREEFAENPTNFMNRENRFETSVRDRDQDRDRDANGQNPGQRTGQVAQLDRFLDDHQQIDRDLTANPSLANNNAYLDQHQDLRTFLNDHPDLREQFAKNPTFFMQRQNQFDAREAAQNQDRDRNANGQSANPDLRNWEVARMDQFLDDHQQIEKDLTANPSLINDQKYLAQHQDLRLFLSNHPQVREEFAENPANFMNRENRFETRENPQPRTGQNVGQPNRNTDADRDRDRDQDRDRNFTDRDQNPNPDLRNWELARMDQFLDDHQPIEKDLTANPSLINDQKYLAHHKDLQLFLNDHPQVREEFAENPTNFMNQENRFETRENSQPRTGQNVGQPNRNTDADRDRDRDQDRDRNFTDRDQDRDRDANGQNPNPDLRNWDLARMDQFLDDHNDVNKDLRAKPSLVNDQKYLAHHKDLQLFLNDHPQVREEFAENPAYFMNRENRFDSRGFAERAETNRRPSNATPNLTDKQAAQMDRFLDKHKDIDRDLSVNPSLCKNDKYLHQHKDLRAFLNKNPEVRTQLTGNSSYFAQRHERMEEHRAPVNRAKKPVKPAPAKTPIEQHETTTPAAPTH